MLAEAPGDLIADRYQILEQLGRGGMAVVYAARDRTTQRTVALKRLLDRAGSAGQMAQLFEREYYILSQLVHPRIIEVYDYRARDVSPFYTMELLSGGDLREQAPLPYRAACRLLCDVCSALALLHSRRLVHRDLTPLNIRCTSDGRAKLFDFGAMTAFGRSKHVVGTPPFIAPEALHGQVLDGRTDLFALGATLYYTLTGFHAYPARSLAELSDCWQRVPPAPSQHVAEIPPALDELVHALLQLDPANRPPTAAEVMERLSVLGGFELEDGCLVRDAYLLTPPLVGREPQLEQVGRALRRVREGRGGSLLVEGAPGTGRSRLLDACALDAKLCGALVLRADADDATGQGWSAVVALIQQLRESEPELAESVLEARLPVLGPLLRAQSRQRTDEDATHPRAQTSRAAVQTAFQQALLDLSRLRPLVLVLDDLERLDEPSTALLSLVANQAREQAVLVLAALGSRSQSHAPQAIRLLQSVSESVRLNNLDGVQTEHLVTSLFGDDPHVHWLADRIRSVTDGNPALVIQVAGYLVQKGFCHYASGSWILPQTLPEEVLARALRETIDPGLPDSALELARVFALSELDRIPLERCLALTSHRDPRRLQADLLALGAAGIVTLDAAYARISRPSWSSLLLCELAPEARRALHLRVAAFLEAEGTQIFRVVQQVLAGGDVARAFDLLVSEQARVRPLHVADPAITFAYTQTLPRAWSQTFHALIEAGVALGRPRKDVLLLQLSLLGMSATTAQTERKMSLEVAQALRRDCGLDLVAALSGRVPDSELLGQALTAAQQRFAATPEHERGMPLIEAIPTLAQIIIQVIAGAARAFDVEWLEAMPALTPLVALSPALAIVQRNLESSIEILRGRSEQAYGGYLEVEQRLRAAEIPGLSGTHLRHMRSAVTFALGMIEANAGRPVALSRADALADEPLFGISALRLRAIYALARGDRQSAELQRAKTELFQIQNAPPQLLEGTQALQWMIGYAAIADLARVKQCLNDIEALAREFPGWIPVAHWARGTYHALRGDGAQALTEYDRALALTSPGRHLVWGWTAGAHLAELTRQERYAEARARGAELLAELERRDMLANAYVVRIPYALALGLEGDLAAALTQLELVEARLQLDAGRGLSLAAAYEVRARLAIAHADRDAFRRYAAAFEAELRLGNHGALLARHARLLRAGCHAGLAERALLGSQAWQAADPTIVATIFESASGPAQRAERALQLLAQETGCEAGRLYLLQTAGPVLAAQLPAAFTVAEELVQQALRSALRDQEVTATTTQTASALPSTNGALERARLVTLVLSHTLVGSHVVTGVVALAFAPGASYPAPQRLLDALSRAFAERGDAVLGTLG